MQNFDQWLPAAREANPGMPDADLSRYWLDHYAGAEQKPEPGIGSDTKNLLASGFDQLAKDLRWGVGKVFGQGVVGALDSAGSAIGMGDLDQIAQRHIDQLSPAMRDASQKDWITEETDPQTGETRSKLGPAWSDWRSYYSNIVQSLPGNLALMGPSIKIGANVGKMAMGRYLASEEAGNLFKAEVEKGLAGGATKDAALTGATDAVTAAARDIAEKAGIRASTIAGSFLEGSQQAGDSGMQVEQDILRMKPEELARSEAYQSMLAAGMSPKEAQTRLAADAGTKAAVLAGIATGLFAGQGDRFLARALRGKVEGGLGARMAKGVASEGLLEEFPQSYLSQVAQNYATRDANPDQGLTQGALNQGVGGFVGGAAMGAGFGAIARESQAQKAKDAITHDGIAQIAGAQNSDDVLRAAVQTDARIDALPAPDTILRPTDAGLTPSMVAGPEGVRPERVTDLPGQTDASIEAARFETPMAAESAAQSVGVAQSAEQAPAPAVAESQAPDTAQALETGYPGVATGQQAPGSASVPNSGTSVPKAGTSGFQATITPAGEFAIQRTDVHADRANLAHEVSAINQQIAQAQSRGESSGSLSGPFNATLAPHELVRGASAMVGTAAMVGARVRFFTPTTRHSIQGFVGGDGTIWISTKATNPHLQVFGHEFDHFIEKSFPELHAEYVTYASGLLTSENKAQVERTHGAHGNVQQEAIANLSGVAISRPEFWDHLSQQNPTLFGKLSAAVKQFFDHIIGRLLGDKRPMAQVAVKEAQRAAKHYADLIARAAAVHQGRQKMAAYRQQQAQQKAEREAPAQSMPPPEVQAEMARQEPAEPKERRPIVGAKEAIQKRKDIARFAKNMGLPEGAQSATTDDGHPMMPVAEGPSAEHAPTEDSGHHSSLQPRDDAGRFNGPPQEQSVGSSRQVPTDRNPADRSSFTADGVENLPNESGWAVLTAEDPNNTKATPAYNKAAMDELRAWLRREGVDFIDVVGKYGTVQNSVIVYGRKVTPEFAERARARFEQESVLVPQGLLYADGALNPADGSSRIVKDDDYYTELPDGSRWNYGIDFGRTEQLGSRPASGVRLSVAEATQRKKRGDEPNQRSQFADEPGTISDKKTISTRADTAPTKQEADPNIEPMHVSLKAALRGGMAPRLANVIRGYTTTRKSWASLSDDKLIERFVAQLTDNLVWLYRKVPESVRELTRQWYVGANKYAVRLATTYGVTDMQAAGVIARLSPQNDWFNNIWQARELISFFKDDMKRAHRWDSRMESTARGIASKERIAKLRGRSFDEVLQQDSDDAGWFFRIWSETYSDRTLHAMSPDGTIGDVVVGKNGAPVQGHWNAVEVIALSIEILRDGSHRSISDAMGAGHKVRNFYNNIISPNDAYTKHVTIDTHAVAAAHLMPFSGKAHEVKHTFGKTDGGVPGTGKSGMTGVNSAYPLYHEAYVRAAERVGVLPRELQSILWGEVRELFPEDYKSQMFEAVAGQWRRYAAGKMTAEQARDATWEIADEYRQKSDAGVDAQEQHTADAAQLGAGELRDQPDAGVAAGRGTGRRAGNVQQGTAADADIPFSIPAGPSESAERSGAGRDGSVAVVGIHYGRHEVAALSGRAFGSGIKGAEQERLQYAADPRIKRRVYFYVSERGLGLPPPEQGLGPWVYRANVGNLYERGVSPDLTFERSSDPGENANRFESAVLDAGYDGYVNRGQFPAAVAVVMNKDVRVELLGNRAQQKMEIAKPQEYVAARPRLKFSLDELPEAPTLSGLTTGDTETLAHDIARDVKRLRRVDPLTTTQTAEIGREWLAYGHNPDNYTYPMSDAIDLKGVARDMSSGYLRVMGPRPLRTDEKSMFSNQMARNMADEMGVHFAPTRAYDIEVPIAGEDRTKTATVFDDGDYVSLNVATLVPGKTNGNLVYQIVGTWAANAGKKFIGDPAGLSEEALFRRTENMFASALRNQSTAHLVLHPYQKAAGIFWMKGDDAFNVGSMATWLRDTMRLYGAEQDNADDELQVNAPARGARIDFAPAARRPADLAFGPRSRKRAIVTEAIERNVRAHRFSDADAEGVPLPAAAERSVAGAVAPEVLNEGPILYSVAEPFYSELSKQVEKSSTNAAPAAGWESFIKGLVNKGIVKQDEVEWSGITEWLKTQGKKVAKADVLAFLHGNGVHVTETVLGGEGSMPEELHRYMQSAPSVPQTAEEWLAKSASFEREAQRYQSAGVEASARRMFRLSEQANEMAERLETDAGSITGSTKYHSYQLPGGQNYRELLLTLPERNDSIVVEPDPQNEGRWQVRLPNGSIETNFRTRELAQAWADGERGSAGRFRSGHFDQTNILAHVRFNERTDADGNKVLFIEEIQSDWAQKGKREGFKQQNAPDFIAVTDSGQEVGFDTREEAERWLDQHGEAGVVSKNVRVIGVPFAPFVGKTDAWVALALKRMIRWAAENGFDRVAWTTGEQQAQRYDLSKQVDEVRVDHGEDGYTVWAIRGGQTIIDKPGLSPNQLRETIGKDLADRAIEHINKTRSTAKFSGEGLKIGGEGMHAFYDKIVPNVANDVLKKLGGPRVSEIQLTGGREGRDDYSIKERAIGGYTARVGNEAANFSKWEDANAWINERVGLKQPGFDITPALRERASGGLPLFSIAETVGDTGRYNAAQKAFFRRVGRTVDKPTLKERIAGLRQDLGKKLAQGLVDQFAPIKDLTLKGYTLLRLAKGSPGAVEAFLRHGKLTVTASGAYDADRSGGFIDRVGVPLHGEVDDFLWWVASHRAERLSKEDREHLFTPEDIVAGKSLADGDTPFDYTLQHGPRAGQTTRRRAEVYADALKTFDAFNKNALDIAEQSGLIDGATRKFWEHEFYVPFYRESEEGGFVGGRLKNGAVRQQAFKHLKGGTDKLNSDLLANTLQNWAHLIDAAAKNRAAKESVEAAAQAGVANELSESDARAFGRSMGARNNVVWYMDEGRQRYYVVEDPYVLTAITAIDYAGMRGPLMDALSTAKHWLTIGVTASPAFKVRNLIRDSIQAIATGDLSYNPVTNVVEGYRASNRETQDYVSALASGALIRFGTMLEGSQSARTRQLIKQGEKESGIIDSEAKYQAFYDKYIEPAWSAYQELGNRGEEINRMALYTQLRKQGVDDATAALMARDLMDFSLQGSWTGIRFLAQVVPFFNARLQGMYKLGRAAKEDPKRFYAVLGATALFSIALMAAYSGDPDWDKREEWDRDNYWWFKFAGESFRIPKPFEIGAIATLAERGLEYFVDPKMTGSRLAKVVVDLVGNNLSMNPVPQAVKPILDVYANKDSFTGRPIETAGMEKLQPDYRYTARTSMVARALSTAGQSVAEATGLAKAGVNFLSPVQIDQMVRGYAGWLGTAIVGAADYATRPMTSEPSRPELDYAKFFTQGMVQDLNSAQSRYVSHLYDQLGQIEQAYGTYRQLVKEGRVAEASAFRQDNARDIALYPRFEAGKRGLSTINQQIRMVENSNMAPSEKRSRIEALQARKDALARSFAQGE